jgi:hypothetical protein
MTAAGLAGCQLSQSDIVLSIAAKLVDGRPPAILRLSFLTISALKRPEECLQDWARMREARLLPR